ncbi:hypothetical protein [Salinispora arenicola]|uniref:Uncharacterized protein n=1 Tax=Salinispora arenicola TaxID=168697 RepID=A0A542XJW5_SALAC|nr:hypothetical protein [Salinispora arenicola]TQL35943.1 hypothetical protein FB564_1014 [Salinispora arenicola]GIM82854.1 hypothetical protein Sar04_09300 [Salinispora arenicola]
MTAHPRAHMPDDLHRPDSQRQRVDLLAKRLLDIDAARRRAEAVGDQGLRNSLLNMARDLIGQAETRDLRSLVTLWYLELGAVADARVTRGMHRHPNRAERG